MTQRLFHTALDSFPRQRISAPNYPDPQSYLPVTGVLQPGATTAPTQVPVTEADIFVSGNGGGANDLCSLVAASPSYTGATSVILAAMAIPLAAAATPAPYDLQFSAEVDRHLLETRHTKTLILNSHASGDHICSAFGQRAIQAQRHTDANYSESDGAGAGSMPARSSPVSTVSPPRSFAIAPPASTLGSRCFSSR